MPSPLPLAALVLATAACGGGPSTAPRARSAIAATARSEPTPTRPDTEQVRSTDLPVLDVPPELDRGDPPSIDAPPAAGIGVDTIGLAETYRLPYGPRTVAFRALGETIGRVRVDGDGEIVECGGASTPVPMRWETLTLSTTEGATFELADGWLDRRGCSATVARTRRAPAARLLRGAFYAFRARQPSGAERVVVLLPRARVIEDRRQGPVSVDPGTITHVAVDLAPGTVASVLLHVGRLDLERWRVGMGPLRGTQHLEPLFEGSLGVPSRMVGVEVIQPREGAALLGVYVEPSPDDDDG